MRGRAQGRLAQICPAAKAPSARRPAKPRVLTRGVCGGYKTPPFLAKRKEGLCASLRVMLIASCRTAKENSSLM